MIDAAKLIARRLPNVLTYFAHRVTNAIAEGLNSKIATIRKRACGGLNLYSAAVTHTRAGAPLRRCTEGCMAGA